MSGNCVLHSIAFAGNPLTRLEELRENEDWLEVARHGPASRFLAFCGLRPLLSDSRLCWLAAGDLPPGRFCAFLGLKGENPCFAVELDEAEGAALLADGRHYEDARTAAVVLPMEETAVMGQGRSLVDWHARHGFCAVCGSRTVPVRGGGSRRCSRDSCGARHFPRVDPVVIMLVTRGDFCLMGRQPRFEPRMYSALAGFMEPGESIEEAVKREIREEASLHVENVRYALSQPWPFPSSLMIGCFATASDDRIIADETELEDLRWFSRDDVVLAMDGRNGELMIPPEIAVAHHLLKIWLEGG